MQTPTRIRVARFLCDLVAIGVGCYCVFGMVSSDIDFGSRAILLPMLALCGIIGGLGFGLSESVKLRRFFSCAILIMCALHFVIQFHALTIGCYAKLATPLMLLSQPCILLLLCVVADRPISRRIESQATLSLINRIPRLLAGITIFWQVMSIAGAVYFLPDDATLAWMLIWSFNVVDCVVWLSFFGLGFWHMTCPVTSGGLLPETQVAVSGKLMMAIAACFVIAKVNDAMQTWQSLPEATAIVVLIGVLFVLIAKYRFAFQKQNTPDSRAVPT